MNASPDPRRPDEMDPLARLLALSPLPQPDAWFTTRTLARCRQVETKSQTSAWFPRWLLGGGMALCVAVFFLSENHLVIVKSASPPKLQAAFEIVASVGSDGEPATSNPDASL